MKGSADTLLVCIDRQTDTNNDKSVLVVGRKLPNQTVEIVNAFADEEAEELYQKLITKAKKEDSE